MEAEGILVGIPLTASIEGVAVRFIVNKFDGDIVGIDVIKVVEFKTGTTVGDCDKLAANGATEGVNVIMIVGSVVGTSVGYPEGSLVGVIVGIFIDSIEGDIDDTFVFVVGVIVGVIVVV